MTLDSPCSTATLAISAPASISQKATQAHLGVGYQLAFPLSTAQWDLGWIGTESTVFVAPVLAPLAVALWWWQRPRPP